MSNQISYPNGVDLFTFKDDQGGDVRVAVKQFPDMMYFWYIENDNDLTTLLASPDILNLQPTDYADTVTINGSFKLPKGGWIRWTNTSVTIYITHNLATYWVAGAAITTLICGLIAAIPGMFWPGIVCSFVWGLTGITIAYYDDYGNPGFYIRASKSPLRVWVTP